MPSLAQLIAEFDPAQAFEPPADWYQGRTVYGGLSAALAVQHCLHSMAPDLPPLKSAQISFVGPATGALRFVTTLLRRGKSVVSVAVDCLSGDTPAVRAALTFAQARPGSIVHDFSQPPTVAPPGDCQPFNTEELGVVPAFLRNFEIRQAGGAQPLSGATHPELLFWMRHRDARDVDPAVALITIADAMPPAVMASFTEPAPVSSMAWSFDLPQPATPGEWFLLRAFSRQAGNGYSLQDMEIWNEAGRSVLQGRQSVAVFIRAC